MSVSNCAQLWLQRFCQANHEVELGVLHCADSARRPVIWPANAPMDDEFHSLAARALSTQRMALQPHGDSDMLMALPCGASTSWALVLRLNSRDRQHLSVCSKRFKLAEPWLQYAIEVDEAEGADPDLVLRLLNEHSLEEACLTLVNQLSFELDCSQAALGLSDGRRVKVQALSHSASFDPRTQVNETLRRAMDEALLRRRDAWLISGEPSADLPYLADVGQHTGASALASCLLWQGREPVAVLVLQWTGAVDAEVVKTQLNQCQERLRPVGRLLSLRASAERAKSRETITLRTSSARKRALRMAAIAALVLAIALIPVPYRISGDALLQGEEKNLVVATDQGYLEQVLVGPGDAVKQGQLLAQMQERELRLERRQLLAELQQLQQRYNNALASSERAQAAVIAAEVDQAEAKLALLEQQLLRAQIRAPIGGVVVSDDIRQSVGKPLERGEVLFEISSTRAYRVIAYIDERHINRLSKGQSGSLVLSSLPDRQIPLSVERITPVSEVREGRNVFRVECALPGPVDRLLPGMTGTAKVRVGRASIGWILFGDGIDWLRVNLW
ncbi:efflux RND transporter periplasmic adaptor subunit [Gilvimarinus sp. DA14]|uniref:efflux RND transporter periplasmic adaptor subunit n=1 Tax=Gilvimarinus sp. DA14 TaxID=2956798 RepID=UPI0020B8F7ED|nr:HlyD family efflux transporter periplasmic adaptor subunit [Gilvimarinus sp. DA14]UTF58941.1 HlyD family efflux transporter periplasmic adaptor subunit [Gilvimarinus sp. DA14]